MTYEEYMYKRAQENMEIIERCEKKIFFATSTYMIIAKLIFVV